MNMAGETNCDDPQFMNMLETCLRAEIESANGTLKSLEDEIKEYKSKVYSQLRSRKELKEKIKTAQENILILADVLNKQDIQINEVSQKIGLTKLNLDDEYKIVRLECQRYENILREYEVTWQTNRAKYEEFPLAKVRREARTKLEKLRVDRLAATHRIEQLEKILKLRDHVTWLRLRSKIVELSRAISNNAKLKQTREDLNRSIDQHKEELNAINKEFARRMKIREEEKKARALKLLEMPPPKINFSYVRNIYGSKPRSNFMDGWKNNDNSMDTMSVDTVMLEELCVSEEPTTRRLSDYPNFQKPDRDHRNRCSSAPSVDVGRSVVQDQEEMEMGRAEAASEMNENEEPEANDAPVEEELEERSDEEEAQEQPEEVEFRSVVREDKQMEEWIEDPPSKRMKLIDVEDKASPAVSTKSSRLERMWSRLTGPSPGPRITKIETVKYAAPTNKANLNPAASMFSPGNYDLLDNSNLSFCVGNNLDDFKADQISLYGASERDFCENSDLSVIQNLTEERMGAKANLPGTSKPQIPQKFDFSNILQGKSSRLF